MKSASIRLRGASVGLSLALGLGPVLALVGLVPGDAAAAPRKPKSGLDRSYAFVAEGDAAFDRGDYDEAIAKYSAAYYVLTSEERASYAGSIPVRNAMRAYDRQVAQDLGRILLDRQLGFVTEYLETVKDHPDVPNPPTPEIIAELEDKRRKIEKKIAELSAVAAPDDEDSDASEDDGAPAPVTETDPEPSPSTDPTPTPEGNDTEATLPPDGPRPSKVGIALAASGGVLVGLGAGVFAGWWTVRNQAPGLADMEPGYEEGTMERETYLQREEDRARRYLVSGAVVMGVGVAVAATGVALILKNRRSPRPLSLDPSFAPGHAGLALHGRF